MGEYVKGKSLKKGNEKGQKVFRELSEGGHIGGKNFAEK
jgi:hypothetical protein